MNGYVKLPSDELLEAGRFDPDCAETSWTLPARWYFDPAVYALEQTRIFARHWCYQCHHLDIDRPGDRYPGEVAGQPVTITRQQNGSLGARLDFDSRPLAVETYAGFVFVNLDPRARPLHQQCGRFLDDIHACCPQLDALQRVHRVERSVAANWKTVVDNNHECYHCAANHRALMQLVDYAGQASWSESGITFSHAIKPKHLDNPAYSIATDALEQESLFGYIWPSLIPLWFPGTPSAVLFQVIPDGPERSILRHDFYFRDSLLTRQEQALFDYIDQVLVDEDLRLCEAVQRGLHSRGYRQGKLIVDRDHPEFSEHHVHFFQQMVYRALREEYIDE